MAREATAGSRTFEGKTRSLAMRETALLSVAHTQEEGGLSLMGILQQMQVEAEGIGVRRTTPIALERVVVAVVAHMDVVEGLVLEGDVAVLALETPHVRLALLRLSVIIQDKAHLNSVEKRLLEDVQVAVLERLRRMIGNRLWETGDSRGDLQRCRVDQGSVARLERTSCAWARK